MPSPSDEQPAPRFRWLSYPKELGERIDALCDLTDAELALEKGEALALGLENFSMDVVRPAWEAILGS